MRVKGVPLWMRMATGSVAKERPFPGEYAFPQVVTARQLGLDPILISRKIFPGFSEKF